MLAATASAGRPRLQAAQARRPRVEQKAVADHAEDEGNGRYADTQVERRMSLRFSTTNLVLSCTRAYRIDLLVV